MTDFLLGEFPDMSTNNRFFKIFIEAFPYISEREWRIAKEKVLLKVKHKWP